MTNETDPKHEIDAALTRALEAMPTDTPGLSRAVLTRLAEGSTPPQRAPWLAEVLTRPAPLFSGSAALLAGAAWIGYIVMPGVGLEDMLMPLTMGGF